MANLGDFRRIRALNSTESGSNSSLGLSVTRQIENVDPLSGFNNVTMTGMALSPEAAGIFIVLYSITTLLAIVGNILAIVVFTKGRKCRTDLRPFLLNLAVADLIMAIFCIPFTFVTRLLQRWVFSPPMCPIVLFLQLTAVTASVFTNTAIGIDRFYAVAFPLKSRIISQRHTIMIAVIWIVSITFNVVQFKVVQARHNNLTQILECVEDWNDNTLYTRRAYTLFILFITLIIPLATLSVTYSIVGCILWRRKMPGQVNEARDQQHNKATRQIVKMLITIVTLFGLCWIPLHAFILTLDFNSDLLQRPDLMPVIQTIYFVVHWIAMSNSFVNPIIYTFMNASFRNDLCSLCLLLKNRSDSLVSNGTLMTQYWKDNDGVYTDRKIRKKMSLPVDLEPSNEPCQNLKHKLDVTRGTSCKAF
ncbi:QRFP-like peptide receptor [Mytilus edulis]|uniref:QRFP-like peptide receptor n=1 Tax=Mytilus edulis TaxID=6550 RepID=UPI0039EF2149